MILLFEFPVLASYVKTASGSKSGGGSFMITPGLPGRHWPQILQNFPSSVDYPTVLG